MSIHDGPYVPLSDRAKRLRDDLRHPAPCPGGDGCMCGLGLDLLIIEHEARTSVAEINALGAAWAEAEAALPEGWKIERLDLGAWGSWWAYAGRGSDREHGEGDTPVAALRALAESLRERAG